MLRENFRVVGATNRIGLHTIRHKRRLLACPLHQYPESKLMSYKHDVAFCLENQIEFRAFRCREADNLC